MSGVMLAGPPTLAQDASDHSSTSVSTCPPGTDANVAGPVHQDRPGGEQSIDALAFDRQAGRIVAVVDFHQTWSFDVCTNSWSRIEGVDLPIESEPSAYDVDRSLPDVLRGAEDPWYFRLIVYDPGADRFVAYFGDSCVGFAPDDVPDDCAGDRTMLLDPETGAWSETRAVTPDMNFGWSMTGHEIAYDESTGRVVIFSDGRVIAYDVAADAWEVLHEESPYSDMGPWPVGPLARQGHAIVYDALNERIVAKGGEARTGGDPMFVPADDVWAFDTRSLEWTQLLARSTTG